MKAIPTKYKDILFKSKLEVSYAKTFDSLFIRWVYEHNGYDLGNIKYLPDFWLPDINTFFEVKGSIIPGAEEAKELSKAIQNDWWNSKIIVVIGNELGEIKMADDNDSVALLKCSFCNNYWFAAISRSYACRQCGMYDGDHHIEKWEDKIRLRQIII